MKQIKLFQDASFKLVQTADINPNELLPGAPAQSGTRTTNTDPSQNDISKVSDENATIITIEGYASVFINPDGSRLEDRDGESVSIALLDIENYKKNAIVVYNHDWGDVAGKVVEIKKDAKGLYVKAEIHKFTGREQVFEAVQKGILKTFSIGFVPRTFTYIEAEDVLEISSAELIEISLAPVPSNQDAIFIATGQKSLKVSKKTIKDSNENMTCDELTGICKMNTKGIDMKTQTKTIKDEPKATEPKIDAAVKVEVSVQELAEQMVQAQAEADRLKIAADKIAEDERVALEAAKEKAEKQRVADALAYIKERNEAIAATAPGDLDVEELDEFYELISSTAELIESKVVEAVTAAGTEAA
jgi:HK97 family phage prohead protease